MRKQKDFKNKQKALKKLCEALEEFMNEHNKEIKLEGGLRPVYNIAWNVQTYINQRIHNLTIEHLHDIVNKLEHAFGNPEEIIYYKTLGYTDFEPLLDAMGKLKQLSDAYKVSTCK